MLAQSSPRRRSRPRAFRVPPPPTARRARVRMRVARLRGASRPGRPWPRRLSALGARLAPVRLNYTAGRGQVDASRVVTYISENFPNRCLLFFKLHT